MILMAKILIIEDDEGLSGNLSNWLGFQGHRVELAPTGEEGLFKIKEAAFDLIVLDWELPGQLNGPSVCKEMRDRKVHTPVMFLTGRAAIADKVLGLEIGADDYLTKPFSLQEFGARLKVLLRRPSLLLDNILDNHGISLDPNAKTVIVKGQKIYLQPLEFSLLEFLMRHPNVVFTSQAILERVWPSDTESSLSTVRTSIKNLRRKLCPEEPTNTPIKNVYGGGYKFEVEDSPVDSSV